jgi:dipeptidyl aminopeptidase/acylaminoacyl peptidase
MKPSILPGRRAARIVLLAGAAGLACSLTTLPAAAADAAASPAEIYGRLPSLEQFALSPDGSVLAYVKTEGEKRNLFIHRLGEHQALAAIAVGDTKLRNIDWADNDNLLITISDTSRPPPGFLGNKQEWYQLATYSVPKGKLWSVKFEVPGETTLNTILAYPMIRDLGGATTMFVAGEYVTDQTNPGLFKVGLDHRTELLERGYEPHTRWLVDATGRVAAEFTYHEGKKQWDLRVRKDDRLTEVASGQAEIDIPSVIGFSADGESIVMEFLENDEPVWKPLLLKDRTWGAPLAAGDGLTGVIKDPKTGRIIGGTEGYGDLKYVFFDPDMQTYWNALLRVFPNERVELVSYSADFTKILVRVFGSKTGYVYAMFDWHAHRAGYLGKVYDGVATIAEVRPIEYKAADGLTIPAYLTLPPGRAEKDLPLIVMPHGGPEAADSRDFDWWAQAYAAVGYAVLQPNFRGSDLGVKFVQAGYGEWGRKMQSDISDGVRHLAKQGLIDPKRVCIVGGSYGGYAALAGATLEPGVYRCAVSVAGISDLKRLLKWTNSEMGRSDNSAQRYWDRFIGATGPNDPALNAISPIEHVSAVTAPILLIHGRDDTVVPYEQSDIMASALKRAGKPFELVTLNKEDHHLSHGATRLQMLQASMTFLKANNPPD